MAQQQTRRELNPASFTGNAWRNLTSWCGDRKHPAIAMSLGAAAAAIVVLITRSAAQSADPVTGVVATDTRSWGITLLAALMGAVLAPRVSKSSQYMVNDFAVFAPQGAHPGAAAMPPPVGAAATNCGAPGGTEDLTWLRDELHDGPAQSLAFALLRMDDVAPASEQSRQALDMIRAATRSALEDLRSISGGLALPSEMASDLDEFIPKIASRFALTHRASVECQVSPNIRYRLLSPWNGSVARLIYECLRINLKIGNIQYQSVTVAAEGGQLRIAVGAKDLEIDGAMGGVWPSPPSTLQIQHLISELGGRVEWKAVTEDSVCLTIEIPFQALAV